MISSVFTLWARGARAQGPHPNGAPGQIEITILNCNVFAVIDPIRLRRLSATTRGVCFGR